MVYIKGKPAMAQSKNPKAKVFMSGRSQAVRIPAEFRFSTKEVYIRRTPGGDVILSTKPEKKTLKEIFAMLDEAGVPDDFLSDRDMRPAEERNTL
jgi:antitoxin VapB